MLILDTDIASLLFEGNIAPTKRLEHQQNSEDIVITIVTWAEIMRGRLEFLLKASDRDQFLKAQRLLIRSQEQLNRLAVLHLDDPALEHFARFQQIKGVKRLGRADLLIGAIAVAQNATVATRNVRHFAAIPNVRLENWRD
jgi:tRNA(fMet)-specific endonuclease VapC